MSAHNILGQKTIHPSTNLLKLFLLFETCIKKERGYSSFAQSLVDLRDQIGQKYPLLLVAAKGSSFRTNPDTVVTSSFRIGFVLLKDWFNVFGGCRAETIVNLNPHIIWQHVSHIYFSRK